MKFPAGTEGGTIDSLRDDGSIRYLLSFAGIIEMRSGSGHGFILAEHGTYLAAYYQSDEGVFRGKEALGPMGLDSGDTKEQSFRLRRYSPAEFARAVRIAKEENLFLAGGAAASGHDGHRPHLTEPGEGPMVAAPSVPEGPRLLDEERLMKIRSQPGVIAVSAFFEGFPVQSVGDEDFEHVAALAEDFLRAGTKVAQEMGVGIVDQLILETSGHKCIIAPCGDLSLCILTTADTPLGLIRVLLRSIQKSADT